LLSTEFDLEVVSRLETKLVVDLLRDDDLPAHPNFDGPQVRSPSDCIFIYLYRERKQARVKA